MKRLGHAYFSPISSDSNADSYLLTQRYAPSLLRIIVDKRACQTRRFNLQMDQQPPQPFILQCHKPAYTGDAFIQSVAETALQTLASQPEGAENPTLSHEFSAIRSPASLIPVAINEITLPTQVRQLKIWSEDTHLPPLNLALQTQAAKPFQFSEQSYLARLNDAPKALLFERFITDTSPPQTLSNNAQQLQNEWLPLKRFLSAQYRHYKSYTSF